MFDVGFFEFLLVFVIGLLVLGPERLPKVATQIGRWVARARRTASQLRHQLEREIALNDLAQSQKHPRPAPPKQPDAGGAETPAAGDATSTDRAAADEKSQDPPGSA